MGTLWLPYGVRGGYQAARVLTHHQDAGPAWVNMAVPENGILHFDRVYRSWWQTIKFGIFPKLFRHTHIFDNKELHPWRLDSFFPVWGPQNPNSIEVWKVMAIEDSKPLNSGQISLHAFLDHCIFQNLLILFVHIELGTKSLLSQHETMTRLFYYHYYWRSGSGERMPCCLRHKKTCVGSEHFMTIMEPCNNWVCLNMPQYSVCIASP